MNRFHLLYAQPLVSIILLLSCAAPPLPTDPAEDARIDQNRSLSTLTILGDSLVEGQELLCTLMVTKPGYVDSYFVDISRENTTIGIEEGVVKDSLVPLVLSVGDGDTGQWTLLVTILKTNGEEDRLTREIHVRQADSSRDAGLDPLRSFRQISSRNDSLSAGQAIICTLVTRFPSHLDNYQIMLSGQSSSRVLASGNTVDALIPFYLSIAEPGTWTLKATVTRTAGGADSLLKTIHIVESDNSLPTADAEQGLYTVHIQDSVTVGFELEDTDGSLLASIFRLTSSEGTVIDTNVFLSASTTKRVERTIHGTSLDSLFCFVHAIDNDQQVSATAQCTVVVIDTADPELSLISNLPDTILNLPVTIRALVTDQSGIDSVTMGGDLMSVIGDTAEAVLSSLDSGITVKTIRVRDRAGNQTTLDVELEFYGEKSYPPELSISGQSIAEGQAFDTIYLMDSVSITNPQITDPASYKLDSLTWTVAGEPGKLAVDTLMGPPRVVITSTDSTLAVGETVSEVISFQVMDSRGQVDEVNLAFVVTGVNDKPVVTIGNQRKQCSAWFDTLSLESSYYDEEDPANLTGRWDFSGGTHLKVDSVMHYKESCVPGFGCIVLPVFTGRITVVPKAVADSNWTGTDTLTFRVQDSDGAWSEEKEVTFSRTTTCIIQPPVIDPF